MTGLVPPAALGEAGISLRPAEPPDCRFLQHLYRSVRWPELMPTGWPDDAKIAFLDSQFDLQDRHFRAAFPGAEFLIIMQRDEMQRDEPIGRLYVDRATRDLYIVELSLLPDRRGRGVGTGLLIMLQGEVRAARSDRVTLDVLADNPARRLYARLGFVETDPDTPFPGLYRRMAWTLPSGAVRLS